MKDKSVPSIDWSGSNWETNRSVEYMDNLSIGDSVTFEKLITETDVRKFAEVTGDTNRLHLDEEFASSTLFNERIVHGLLTNGLVSAAIARLPGLAILIETQAKYKNPASIGEKYIATCEVVEDLGENKWRVKTKVVGEGTEILTGEAIVLLVDVPVEG